MNAVQLALGEAWSYTRGRAVLVVAVVILVPVVSGLIARGGYSLWDGADYFSLQLSNLVPLLFPFLVVAIYLPRLSDEFANGFTRSVRTRTTIGTYLASRLVAAAILAFLTFAAMVVVVWLVSFVADPLLGLNDYGSAAPPGQEDPIPPLATRFTFSQLFAYSSAMFGVGYAAWVGINAATYAVLGGLALALVENRFIALSVPAIVYWLGSFVTAVLGWEEFSPSTSVFPFSITQQEIWQPFVQWGILLVAVASAVVVMRKREYDVPGLG